MGALERWEAFLAQIETRHRQVREQASAATMLQFPAVTQFEDATRLVESWQATKDRLQELEQRIEATWQAQVSAAMKAEGVPAELQDSALSSGRDVAFHLQVDGEAAEANLFARLARSLIERALASPRACACPGCGGPLDVPLCFTAQELRCSRCGTRTDHDPGDLLRAAAAWGSHPCAQDAAFSQWLAMRKTEHELHQTRPPYSLRLIKELEMTQLAYWETYFQARAYFEPAVARDHARLVKSRMAPWYTHFAQQQEAWLQAGL